MFQEPLDPEALLLPHCQTQAERGVFKQITLKMPFLPQICLIFLKDKIFFLIPEETNPVGDCHEARHWIPRATVTSEL